MRNILVTGAGGFIGKRLVRILEKHGHNVLALISADGDIADPNTMKRFHNAGIGFVFHLAGRTYIPDAWENPAEFLRVNIIGTLNVLEFCRTEKISMTYVSAYIYGAPEALPIREDHKIEPNNPYAMSKYQAEILCRHYAEFFKIPLTIIRPFNIYGPGQKAHFLIPEIIRQVKTSNAIRLKDLSPKRDYLYLDDLIEALLHTLNPKPGYQIYNIGYGSSLSVEKIVGIVQTIQKTSLPVVNENRPRHNEIADVYADTGKAQLELNWRPRFNFEEGVKMMILDKEIAE